MCLESFLKLPSSQSLLWLWDKAAVLGSKISPFDKWWRQISHWFHQGDRQVCKLGVTWPAHQFSSRLLDPCSLLESPVRKINIKSHKCCTWHRMSLKFIKVLPCLNRENNSDLFYKIFDIMSLLHKKSIIYLPQFNIQCNEM